MVHLVHIVHALYMVHMVHFVYKLYMIHMVHLVHTLYMIHIVHIVHGTHGAHCTHIVYGTHGTHCRYLAGGGQHDEGHSHRKECDADFKKRCVNTGFYCFASSPLLQTKVWKLQREVLSILQVPRYLSKSESVLCRGATEIWEKDWPHWLSMPHLCCH